MFRTAFDVTDVGYQNLWFCCIGLIPIAIGLVWWRVRKDARKATGMRPWLLFLFGITWIMVSFVQTYSEYRALAGIERRGDFKVVEGEVASFSPAPYVHGRGQPKEGFSVNGVRFEYLDDDATAGFHRTTAHGGPIHNGLYVRIEYYDGQILRLDIRN